MGNGIKENIKNQMNQLTDCLIDCNKKRKLLKTENLMEEELNHEISEIKIVEVLISEIQTVKTH